MRAVIVVGALMAVLESVGYLALGAWGVLAASICGPLVMAAGARGALPATRHRRRRAAVASDEGSPPFASYRRMSSMITWTIDNRHYYEAVTRPFFTSTVASLLAERHHVDLEADPTTARRILGPQVWDLVDPRAARADGKPVTRDELTQIVDRLEQL